MVIAVPLARAEKKANAGAVRLTTNGIYATHGALYEDMRHRTTSYGTVRHTGSRHRTRHGTANSTSYSAVRHRTTPYDTRDLDTVRDTVREYTTPHGTVRRTDPDTVRGTVRDFVPASYRHRTRRTVGPPLVAIYAGALMTHDAEARAGLLSRVLNICPA